MHSKSFGRVWLLTALAALVLGVGQVRAEGEPQNFGEDYAPPDPVWPFPIGNSHPEDGGLFVSASFVSYRQTNPLKDQLVGQRGWIVSEPVIAFQNATGANFKTSGLGAPGTLEGSGAAALDVNQVSGPTDFEPGVATEVGWRFGDGSSFSVKWLYIDEVNLSASATLVPRGQNVGPASADSFLFAPVFNFPSDFAGPQNKITIPNPSFVQGSPTQPPFVAAPGAAYGIWDGASVMTEQFLQRTQQWEGIYRVPIYETEDYRLSGLVGPRFTWIWERYKWVTSDLDINGNASPDWSAQYTNVTSNRMYGVNVGCEQECYLGHGFAADVQLRFTGYEDSVKEEAKYQLARGANGQADPGPIAKRSRVQWTFVPEPELTIGMSWFPIEAVEIRAGYDIQAFFNTVSMNQPVDFNFGSVDPRYETSTVRLMDGFNLGIGIHF